MAWGDRLYTTTFTARLLPADFVLATATGGVFTVVTYVMMFAVFVLELRSFLMGSYSTYVSLDKYDTGNLQINFDIDLHDIECKNLHVVVFSHDGEEPLNMVAKDFWLRAIDQAGRPHGAAKRQTDDFGDGKSRATILKEEGQQEVDSDWMSSHDGFTHQSFEHVIKAHDFTLVNFFASWCGHCQQFSPTWMAIARKFTGVDENGPKLLSDKSGQKLAVQPIKMNCVDFRHVCHSLNIDAFPTIRLYKGDGTYILFEGKRAEKDVMAWVEQMVKKSSQGWSSSNDAFERGCNARGRLQVARVPGHLGFMSGGGDQDLDPSLTNVSHLLRHLSFSDPGNGAHHRKSWTRLPREISANLNPIDSKNYVTKNYHEAWMHDMKVVSTVGTGGRIFYQFSHHHRLASVEPDALPQVRFHYDIEPFSIILKNDAKRWYSFLTSLLAITGGTFVLMRLLSMSTQSIMGVLCPRKKTSRITGQLDGGLY
eukprot:NODE_4896_length_1833_cov_7.763189.p1 GENE.NODE_4896_length_1833_cov_7.763189~~NODE_4896_length_1833_cov_7.763189.p1  ORF type:complete len:481 (+),score=83.39 NODE_4896_length_1833_cov_7.763189:113-1555(+)